MKRCVTRTVVEIKSEHKVALPLDVTRPIEISYLALL